MMRFYAVRKGNKKGIIYEKEEFKRSIKDYPDAEYRICKTEKEAEEYIMRAIRKNKNGNRQ